MYNRKPSFSEWSASEYYELDNEPFRTRVQRKGVGIIDMEYYQDEMIMYCPHCSAAGFKVKLGPKILMPNEERQPDYDQWLECPDCGKVVASYVVEHDATIITDTVETVNNPFENQTEIMGVAKRSSPAGRKRSAKRKKERYGPHQKDPEIQRELDKGNIVNILYDSNR